MPESQRLCSASERISTSDKIYDKVIVTRTGHSSFLVKPCSCHVRLQSNPGRSRFQQMACFSVVRLAWKCRLTLTLYDMNYGPTCGNWRFKWICSTWCRSGCRSIFDAFFHLGNMQKVLFPWTRWEEGGGVTCVSVASVWNKLQRSNLDADPCRVSAVTQQLEFIHSHYHQCFHFQ